MIYKINPATLTAVGEDLVSEQNQLIADFSQKLEGVKLIKMINIFTQARNEIKISPIAQLPLELAVMELCSQ